MNKGFTLIELLVVVLIIGILAAIALPQYTRAVERSRMAEAVQVLGDFATAQSIYYMQHNNFAGSADILRSDGDITVSDPGAQWSVLAFNPATGAAPVQMTLQREGGMYSGGQLTIQVSDTGAIQKTCGGSAAAGFCNTAASMGYGS